MNETNEKLETPLKPFSNLSIALAVVYAGSEFAQIFFAVPPLVKILGVLAILLLLGAGFWFIWTALMKLEYRLNPAVATVMYGFPSYAAWRAAQPWYARLAACP